MFDELKETRRGACLKSSRINLHKFCMALPSNLEFIKGFEMNRPMVSNNLNCYCPCSKKGGEWQNKLNLELYCSTKKKEFTPVGLLDHVSSFNDMYHMAVKFYLENLYAEALQESKQARKA